MTNALIAENICMKITQYGYQIQTKNTKKHHSEKTAYVHTLNTYIHLCVKYEVSKANGVVTVDIGKIKQMWLPN